MIKPFKLEVFKSKEKILYLPVSLEIENITAVSLGSSHAEALCRKHPNGRNVAAVSSSLAEELSLPPFITDIYMFQHENSVILGPLIGIFTSGFTSFLMKPIGERSSFFSKLLSLQSSLGVIPFVFGENHIDWENGLVKGHFYSKNQWVTHVVPLPNVIYDRLPNRRSEKKSSYQEIKSRLQQQYGIPWYNPGFFNKLEVFERLENDEEALRYLPETHAFQSFSQIERMMSKYGHVFIKPKNGSLGLGVHQFTFNRISEDYTCRFRDKSGRNRLVKSASFEKLLQRIIPPRILSKMVIQQGIHLIKSEDRPVDFRVHTNKDENGEWQVSAIAAKVAGEGSVTTHLHNGGCVKSLQELFPDPDLCLRTEEKLKSAAITLSSALERNMEGFIGEIGFDFGIDALGRVWLFEANSKPGRSIFSHPDLKSFDLLTRRLSLSFGLYLTQRSIKQPQETLK
ncbi:YheC/YheD family protein [Rossellomorea vietnamensis]|uniref:YheC/YheD family endospore coat-associated protein n=1 Tax=Rossellomorea vietnamensis TaxID=218284 RepID=UPI003CF8BE30